MKRVKCKVTESASVYISTVVTLAKCASSSSFFYTVTTHSAHTELLMLLEHPGDITEDQTEAGYVEDCSYLVTVFYYLHFHCLWCITCWYLASLQRQKKKQNQIKRSLDILDNWRVHLIAFYLFILLFFLFTNEAKLVSLILEEALLFKKKKKRSKINFFFLLMATRHNFKFRQAAAKLLFRTNGKKSEKQDSLITRIQMYTHTHKKGLQWNN